MKHVIIGISGASGAAYGYRLLELLHGQEDVQTHLVMSEAASCTISHELEKRPEDVIKLAGIYHENTDIGASIASGSFESAGMIIAPCSMKTLSAVAYSMADSLLTRAADVMLKERRKLVLMARETPLHAGHIRAMLAVTEMGGIIAPPVPAMYAKPQTIDDIVNYSAIRALGLIGIRLPGGAQQWSGLEDGMQNCPPEAA